MLDPSPIFKQKVLDLNSWLDNMACVYISIDYELTKQIYQVQNQFYTGDSVQHLRVSALEFYNALEAMKQDLLLRWKNESNFFCVDISLFGYLKIKIGHILKYNFILILIYKHLDTRLIEMQMSKCS